MTNLGRSLLLLFGIVFISKDVHSFSTILNDVKEVPTSTLKTTGDENHVHDSVLQDSPNIDRRIGEINPIHEKLVNQIVDLHFSPTKRRHRFADSQPSDLGTYNLIKVVPFAVVCPNSVEIRAIIFNGHLVTVCIAANRRSIEIARFEERTKQWIPLPFHFKAVSAQKVALFVDHHYLYVLIADLGKGIGIDLIRINRAFELIPKEHTIDSHFMSSVAVWKSLIDKQWVTILAIANSVNPRGNGNTNLQSKTTIYTWRNTYFDMVDYVPSLFVKDLCPFSIYEVEYIAIINQKADEYNFDVDSQIFHFDTDAKKLKLVQSIRTFAASDAEFFTLGRDNEIEHFLVIANEYSIKGGRINYKTDSIIYKFSVDKFLPFQCLKTIGATQVTTFKGDREQFVLLIVTRDGVKMYQYNGWRFTQSDLSLTPSTMGPGVTSLSTASFGDKSLVLVSYSVKNFARNVFELVFTFENPLGEWYDKSLKWCSGMIRNHSVADPGLEKDLKHVFFINQEKPIEIRGILELHDFSSKHLRAPRILDESLNHEYNYEIINTLEDIERQLVRLESELYEANNALKYALSLSGNQRVFAPVHIKEAEFVCSHPGACTIGAVSARTLNGIPNFGKGVLRTDMDQTIHDNFKLNSANANSDVIVDGLIDGINSTAIVTKTGNHFLMHPISVDYISTHTANIAGLVNGHRITRNDVLLTVGNQEVESEIIFRQPFSVNNLRTNFVGQRKRRQLRHLISGIVTHDGTHTIKGFKLFNWFRGNQIYQMPMSTVNGVDLRNQWDNLLWTFGNQKLTSSPLFANVIVAGDVVVDGMTNKIRLPAPNIVTTRGNFAFSGPKVFLRDTLAHRAVVLKSLNGLPTINGHLNILLRNKPQTINIQKKFRVVRLGGKSNVIGNIQGIKLAKFLQRTLWKNETQRFRGRFVIDGNVRFVNGVDVRGNVANINLGHLYDPSKTMFLNEKYFPNYIRPRFEWFKPVAVNARIINGFDIGRDFLTRNTVQRIEVPVTFKNIVNIQKSVTIETLNNIHLSDIRNSLLTEGAQQFSEDMVVDGDLFVREMDVTSLNKYSMDDFVYLNRPQVMQEIYATKNFENVVVLRDVDAKNIEGVVVINNIHFRDLIDNTLRYDEHQVITGRKLFGSISVPANSHIDVKMVNKVDLKLLESSAVLKNSPYVQEVRGKVIFRNQVSVLDFWFTSLFDRTSMAELLNYLALQGVPQTIHGNLIIANNVSLNGKLITRNGLNGIDLVKLSGSVVKLNTPSIIFGRSQFLGGSRVDNNVHVLGKFGGIDLRNALKKHSNGVQVIYGLQFLKGSLTSNAVLGKGWFNGISMEDLCAHSVRKDGSQVIKAPVVIFGNAEFPSLKVFKNVNNVNLLKVRNEMVFKNKYQKIEIYGKKNLDTLIIDGPARIRGMFNQINWKLLSRNYMSLTKEQVIQSPLIFASGLSSINPVFVDGNLYTANGLINNISLFDLNRQSVKNYGIQSLKSVYAFENVQFQKNLYLEKDLINGIRLQRDLMIKGRRNVVTAPKIIAGNVIVRKDLDILNGKTINGIDFSQLVSATVNRHGIQVVTGRKRFRLLRATDVYTRRPLSGVWFSKHNILLSNSNQKMRGNTQFLNGFHVNDKLYVSGLINGLKLEEVNKALVKKGSNNTIYHLTTFKAPLRVLKGMNSKSHINGLNVSDVIEYVQHPMNLGLIPMRIQNQKTKFEWLKKNSELLSQQINFFTVTHQFKNERLLEMANKELRSNYFYFAAGNEMGCESIVVKYFTRDGRVMHQPLKSFWPYKVVEFVHNGVLHILVVNKRHIQLNQLLSCLSPSSDSKPIGAGNSLIQLFAFQPNNQHFVPLSSLLFDEVSDLSLLSINPSVCFTLVVRLNERVFVSCLHNGLLTIPQNHPLHSIGKISTVHSAIHRPTLMAAYSSKSMSRETFKVNLFEWLPLQKFNHIETITAVNPKLVYFVETATEERLTFLFIGEAKASFLRNEPLMRVFLFKPGFKYPFIETQQFRVDFVSIDSIYMPDNRLLVFILTRDNFINIYELKGASGFQLVDTVFSNSADTFTAKMTEARVQIALSDQENSYVLSAVMKG